MIIEFRISNLDTHPSKDQFKKTELNFYDFISVNGEFEFYIDESLVLQESCWNVGELAHQLVTWKNEGFQDDFQYACVDSEERDLFTFNKANDGFKFMSQWAVKNVDVVISRSSMESFIDAFSQVVKRDIKLELNFDVSKFL